MKKRWFFLYLPALRFDRATVSWFRSYRHRRRFADSAVLAMAVRRLASATHISMENSPRDLSTCHATNLDPNDR